MLALPRSPSSPSSASRRTPAYYASAVIALVLVTAVLLSLERRQAALFTTTDETLITQTEHWDGVEVLDSSTSKTSRVCDQHKLPGVLHLSENFDSISGALETAWIPLSDKSRRDCPSRNYTMQVAALQQQQRTDSSSASAHSLPKELFNRTILMIGDSIDRANAQYTCHLLGGNYESIVPGHPYWPQSNIMTAEQEVTHIANGGQVPEWRPNEYSPRSFPTYCRVDSIDLVVMNVFHFGLDQEGYFEWKDQYGPPYQTQDRIREIAVPFVQKVGRQVDILEFSSGLWDLARFGRQDDTALTADSTSTVRHLSLERLEWFSERFQSILSLLTPSSKPSPSKGANSPLEVLTRIPLKYIRRLHVASDDDAGSFQQWWQVPGAGATGEKHTYYFPSWRIGELNSAITSAVLELGESSMSAGQGQQQQQQWWEMDTWGDKLFGMELFEKGNVHPHYAATTLWLEQMFYRLVNGQ